ncbi:signal recognition particle-docking protein FtsY [Roseibium marinum]|uniref:Signal recognition particle receptor FtsY n=1 Tax=Roseibium marinum TaxID=281252 RepID=A0A2S3UYK0_9HYPH|nr:signal recognition particle-docking protein FtsY [Roseibium marinum]POF32791.1 fused signal recognition particle receptor [Roseibium marinum]
MSEKKRGFLGRLFGGKETPDGQEETVAETAAAEAASPEPAGDEPELDVEMEVRPAAAINDPFRPIQMDAALGRLPDMPPPVPVPIDEPVSTDVAPEPVAEPNNEPENELSDEAAPEPEPATEEPKSSWVQRLKKGLSRSSSSLTEGISSIFTKRKLDASMLEELEDVLIQADLGVDTAMAITERLSVGRFDKEISTEDVRAVLAEEVEKVLEPVARPLDFTTGKKPHVVLMVGVNGTGKTTTIGKLSQKLRSEGKKVMMAAGDTFRAAAVEQLRIWAGRTGAEIVARDTGSDAAGLAYDAMKEAADKDMDVLLIDTAGRLQNRTELMEELEKVIRVIRKLDPDAPHTVLLTLDATTGQNALNQVEIFGKVAGVTGLVMTKLDGTARGGILVAIAAKHGLPVHFIGVGEGVADLEPFSAKDFAGAIAGMA